MGVVFRARHVILNKSVAVKILRKAHDEAAWKRFVQEAQTASSVNHFNVVGISDFGVIGGHAYLVMELMEGQTLTDIVNAGPCDPLRVCRIGAQIARGLQAVHDKGVVHRDLKPDNIFLVEREGKIDVVKIVDFGLAKSEAGQRLTQDGTVVGTAEYISPEQVTGQDTDARSDQYSLGCILYEMLTSQLPFEGESTATLIYKHVYKNPVTPRKVRPEMSIPSTLESVVLKCMAKKPQDRFPTMAAVEQALLLEEQALAHKTTSGVEALMISRRYAIGTLPWQRWAALGTAGLLLLILAIWLLGRKSPAQNDSHKPPDRPAVLDMTPRPTPDLQKSGVSPNSGLGTNAALNKTPLPPPEEDGEDPNGKPSKSELVKEPSSRPIKNSPRSTMAVRLTIEPAAVSTQVACKSRRITCRGGCQLQVSEGTSCSISAPGYVTKDVRFGRGKSTLHVRLSPVKLKLH